MKSANCKGKPMSFMEFAEKYATEAACREKMFEARWPEGFVCPKCGGRKYCFIASRNAYQCNKCKHRTTQDMYYIRDNHEPIIDREVWIQVQQVKGVSLPEYTQSNQMVEAPGAEETECSLDMRMR